MAGAIAVAGVGAVIYNDNQNTVNTLNDENAKLAARVKSLEDNGYVLPSSITTSINSNKAVADASCTALKAIDTMVLAAATPTAAEIKTAITGAYDLTAVC